MTEPTAESASSEASKERKHGQDMVPTKSDCATSSPVMSNNNNNKRKKSTLDQEANDGNVSSSSLPSAVAKRSRSSSTDSQSSSSWLQRLYPSRVPKAQPPDNISEKKNDAVSSTSSKNDPKSDAKAADSEDGSSLNGLGSGSGGDDGNDDGDNNGGKNKADSSSSGIWSWFGYGTNTTDASVQERMDNKEHQQERKQKQGQDQDQDQDMEIQKEEEEEKNADKAGATNDSNRSLWRSFFWSSTSPPSSTTAAQDDAKQDSVVVERSDSSITQDQQDKKIEKSKEAHKDPVARSSSSSNKDQVERPSSPKRKRKNVVLPTIDSQFVAMPDSTQEAATTSLLSKALRAINSMFASSSGTDPSGQLNPKMAKFIQNIKADPKTIAGKRFVIVGVHGWFPMKLVRSVIGEPTGTSIKFCDQMVCGVREYFRKMHNLEIPMDAVTTIPLEGEGKVEERVEKLYNILKDKTEWMEALTSADVIFWATHSQGTPVSAILLHRLIAKNHIDPASQALCLLAMAGIAHGPFPSLKGSLIVKYFEADAARELFEFMDSTSDISQKFRQSLAFILNKGTKTVLVGSMQDQVVPLYSAIMAGASHPSILRAVYIDGHVYSEQDFLINLITFALRLRNAGFSDHGLLTHISEVLAGNLYQWEGGHSTIYEEIGVYELAVQYLFETKPFGNLVLPQQQQQQQQREQQHVSSTNAPENKTATEAMLDDFQAKLRQNPFYLPWAMRGICDDARVLGDQVLSQELEKLRDLFDRWVPSSTKMREIKFRLEPLKARL